MPTQNLTDEAINVRRTQRAAAMLAAAASVIWGAAALLTSQDTATAVDTSAPIATVLVVDPPATISTVEAEQGGESTEPTEPTDPADPADPADPEPQVPLGGNGEVATPPTTEPPSCNGSCTAPVDLHPFEVEIGRTPAGIGLANAVAGGCSTDCITRAQVFQDADTTDVAIEIETHTPAFIAVYVDDVAPSVTPDGRPYFPGAQPVVNTHGDLDLSFADTLRDLEEDTQYWIIVRATDTDVRSSFVVGSVVTTRINDDAAIMFAAIDIIYDGDHGRNKGELTFEWTAGAAVVGYNGEYERGDGSRIDLTSQDHVAGIFDLSSGDAPLLQMRGVERDPEASPRYCSHGSVPEGYGTNNDCGLAWNSTVPYTPTLEDISQMADCSAFDLDELYFDGWVCTRIATVESHGGIPEFSVVVAFRVN